MGLFNLEQTKAAIGSGKWENNGATLRNTLFSAKKSISGKFLLPIYSTPPLLSPSLAEHKHTLSTSCTAPCLPREREIGNETHYMQIGFNHLEQMAQKVAGKCNFEFPLDVS